MIVLLLCLLAFLLLVFTVSVANLRGWPRLDPARPLPAAPPLVSILVPARNEAANIAACVRSLLAQDYPHFEVLVLDDESADDTAAQVLALAAADARLRLLRGAPLPEGWLGKAWACRQLAEAARGEVFLFADADTIFQPSALRAAVAALAGDRADLLAVLPRQTTVTWAERLLVPVLGWSLFSLLPVGLAHRWQSPALAATPGQCLLVRRAAYERAGGHAAVRAHAAEDLALGRALLRVGARWRLYDAGAEVRCRMYRSLPEIIQGFSKNLFAAFDSRPLPFLWGWLWLTLSHTVPGLVVVSAALGLTWPPLVLPVAVAAVILAAVQWGLYAWRFGQSFWLVVLYPGVVVLAFGLALRSWGLALRGRAVWKGRTLARAAPRPLPPSPGLRTGLRALRALLGRAGPLGALAAVHRDLGDVFQLPLPGFHPIVVAGPAAAQLVFLTGRDRLSWRLPSDPVARLLRHGLLVEDGPAHDLPRAALDPALHRRRMAGYLSAMQRGAETLTVGWGASGLADLLPAIRATTLHILLDALLGADPAPALAHLRRPIERTLDYIAPGPWLVWPGVPRLGYAAARRALDHYLYDLIAARRAAPGPDLVSDLLAAGFDDEAARDHLLTLLIAGHDTSTALLSWALVELARHPVIQARARAEVTGLAVDPLSPEGLRQLVYLDQVIAETLRLHPPIHVGNRRLLADLDLARYRLPAGRRLLFSIYLTHHDPAVWPAPQRFDPERFAPSAPARPRLSYVPYGAGPRFCLGAVFAHWEAKVVLAHVLRAYALTPVPGRPSARPRMGATLMPPQAWVRYQACAA